MEYNVFDIEELIDEYICASYNRDYDGDDMLNELLEVCRKKLGVDAIYVLVSLVNSEGFIFRYESFEDEKYNYINEIRHSSQMSENYIDYKIDRSLWCDGVVGFIDGTGKREWSEDDKKILIKLGRCMRPAVLRARLEKCTSELKKKEKVIKKIENHARNVIESDMKNRQYQNLLFSAMSDNFVVLTKIYLDTMDVTRFQMLEGVIIEENQYKKWDEVYENFTQMMMEEDKKRIDEEYGVNMFFNHNLGEDFHFEYRTSYARAEKEYKWHRSKVKVLEENDRNIAIIYTEDISQEKDRETDLENSNKKLKDIISENTKMNELVTSLVVDNFVQVMEIDIATRYVSRLKRLQNGMIVKQDMKEKWNERYELYRKIIYPEDFENFSRILSDDKIDKLNLGEVNRIRFRARYDFEKKYYTPNKEYLWYTARVYLSVEEGRKKVLICIINDANTIEYEIKQKTLLKTALIQAGNANRAKNTFLSNMSHFVRTPLTSAMGYMALAKANVSNHEKLKKYIDKTDEAVNDLFAVLNDLLDITRIESGKIRLNEKENSFKEVIDEVSDSIMSFTIKKHIKYIITKDIFNDTAVFDKRKVSQILSGLLENALENTSPGGCIELSAKQIGINKGKYATYQFTVKDNGHGIKKEQLKNVFEPFFKEETEVEDTGKGYRLSLAIVKSLTDMMGGKIEIESKENEGTKVEVRLELAISHINRKLQEDIEDKEQEKNMYEKLIGRNILLADDNQLNAEVVIDILSEYGMDVDYVKNGEDATDMFKYKKEGYFDAILMDIEMPVVNGYDATDRIRNMNRSDSKTIPIIALSASVFEEDVKKSLDSGMDAHISKPIDKDEMINILAGIIR